MRKKTFFADGFFYSKSKNKKTFRSPRWIAVSKVPASVRSHRHLQVSLFSLEFLQCNKSCPVKKPCGYLPVLYKKEGYVRCVEISEIYVEAN